MKRCAPILLALALTACGTALPPANPSGYVWGFGYQAQVMDTPIPVGDTHKQPGRTTGYRVSIARNWQVPWVVAHELAHVWQWHYKVIPAGGVEAHADAVARAVIRAGCETGDLGWPGGEVTGCTLPDPREITP